MPISDLNFVEVHTHREWDWLISYFWFDFAGCVSKILTRFYETGSIRPGSIGGSKTKVSIVRGERFRTISNLQNHLSIQNPLAVNTIPWKRCVFSIWSHSVAVAWHCWRLCANVICPHARHKIPFNICNRQSWAGEGTETETLGLKNHIHFCSRHTLTCGIIVIIIRKNAF